MRFHFLAPGQHREFLDEHLSVAVFDCPGRGLRALGSLLRQFLKLRRDIRPDIYFFHSSFALLPLLVLRLMRDRTPTLYCAHGWAVGTIQSGAARHRLVAMIERRLCRLADHVVNVLQNDQAAGAEAQLSQPDDPDRKRSSEPDRDHGSDRPPSAAKGRFYDRARQLYRRLNTTRPAAEPALAPVLAALGREYAVQNAVLADKFGLDLSGWPLPSVDQPAPSMEP